MLDERISDENGTIPVIYSLASQTVSRERISCNAFADPASFTSDKGMSFLQKHMKLYAVTEHTSSSRLCRQAELGCHLATVHHTRN